MAKKSNNELLGEILDELESIRVDQEKNSNKGDNDSIIAKLFNGPASDNEKKGSDKQTMTVLNSLKMIIDAVKGVSKVSAKDVDHVKNVVTSLSSVLGEIKFGKEQVESFQKFADTMQKLNTMMESLNGNLLKTIWKFNPIRGKLLGYMVAGFYSSFFEAFEDAKVFTKISDMSKNSVDSFAKINEQITKLFSLNAKTVWLLGKAFKNFPPEAANNICSFLTNILDTVKKYPSGTKEFKEKTDNFVAVMAAMATVPFMQLWLMEKFLKPEAGEKIGNFFASLIKGLNEISSDKLKQTSKVMFGMSALLLSITASLLMVVFIATKFELKEIGLGFLIMIGLISLSITTMWMLSLISFKEEKGKVNAKDALIQAGAIALLLSTLTLSLMITVSIAKNNKLSDITLGVVMIGVIVLAMIGVMYALTSDKLQKGSKDALATAGALVLMSIAVLAMAGVLALIAKDPISVLIGLGVSAAIIVGMSALLWVSSQLVDKGSDLIKKGLIGIGAITLATIAITYAAKKYMDLMQQIKDLDAIDIASGSGIVLGLLLSTTGIIFAASATLMGPQAIFFEAGMAAVVQISGAILLISKASKSYIDLIKQIKDGNISNADIELASNMLYGNDNSMVQFIKNTVNGLSDIGVWSAVKVKMINKQIQPLFTTIGKFMKIIENMASLRYVESYDPQTGKPKYGKMDKDAFTTAATTLALGFNTFLNTLVNGEDGKGLLSTDTAKKINEICQNLCPKNSVVGFIFRRSASVGDLLNVLGKFVGIIQKMANLKLPVYDENGNITGYDSYNQNAFTAAATNIASGFTAFIKELAGIQNSGDIEDIIDDIADGDTLKLIKCLGSFVDIIKSMADMKYVERYENGKPIYREMRQSDWETAGKNIAFGFSSFLTTLHTELKGKSGRIEDIIDDIGGKDTEALFTSIKTFTETIQSINIDNNLSKKGEDIAIYFSDFLKNLYNELNGKDREIKSIIKVLTSSGNGGIKELGSSIAAFYDATKDIQIDDTIAINIDTVISKFVAMEDNIKKFNRVEKTLSKSLSDFQKTAEIIKSTVQLDDHTNLTDITLSLSNASSNIIEMISKMNQSDIKAYNENIDMLKSGMSGLRKIMKISKTMLSDAYGVLSDSAGTIKKGISTIFEQFNNVVIKAPSIEAPSVDHDALQQVNIEVLNAKAMAFDGITLSIEKTNAQMARLVQLEKEWQKLSNESVFKNLAEMMKQQAEALNEAVKSFTEQVEGESTIRVQISPADIAAGIEQASWQYSKGGNNNYVKI